MRFWARAATRRRPRDAAGSGAPAGDENASGEPEDDVVQQDGAAQTPADVASGEDTEKVA